MDAGHNFAFLLGCIVGAVVSYIITWYQARRIEALVPGGLRAWDLYNKDVDTASPTGRTVTQEVNS